MKRLLILITLMASGTLLNAQRGRFYESDNIGLPSFEFAGKSLLLGAILIIIAFIANAINQNNGKNGSFFGGICFVLGFICCVPTIAWLQAIIGSILMFGIIILVAIVGIILIWDYFKNK